VDTEFLDNPVARARAEQLAASDPRVSAFVSAHAGTGKTKLLIDRLLRLMLEGADPDRILCLTYTKAAAAEMANRLHERLGRFVAADDATLDGWLRDLQVDPTEARRSKARALFATVLDLPGGMRIGTIHAFCQSLLRRFPLEAEISPHFRIMEDADARASLDDAREAALPMADGRALAALAGLVGADDFGRLLAMLEDKRDALAAAFAMPAARLGEALRRSVGLPARCDARSIVAEAARWPGEAELRAALMLARNHGSPAVADKAGRMLGWLALTADLREEHWDSWLEELFRKDGERSAVSKFCNEKLAKLHPNIGLVCEAEQARVEVVLDRLAAFRCVEATAALLSVARPILGGMAAARERVGLLDYDELIGRTASLLSDPGRAAWVLFKLDGGLDHLLLDEVQDTAPAQWRIAADLTGDFFTGIGAREAGRLPRTVFAVGDAKQSIYSFQGADPGEFDRWRAYYAKRAREAGQGWRETVLDVSFRTTSPVLALVDAVFADAAAACGVCTPGALRHVARRSGHAGVVEFWPLAPRPEPAAPTPWSIPRRNQGHVTAPQTLVAELARWIAQKLEGAILESEGRPLRPGDFLVLVRRRGQFDRALVRALKALDVPVAGLDRMVLTEQPAVQDLLALCRALLLPGDDLSFAEFLVSPLGGLSDDDLMQLAPGRGEASLWDVLWRRAGERFHWGEAAARFAALLARVDYAAPYALLAEALGPLGGRARLFARLGPEAAEPVDEFLAAALQFASQHPPSLQGFLRWLDQAGSEVKRQAESAGNTVRIMTVHGAKGLEAPVVILPDTTGLPPVDRNLCWTAERESGTALPLWTPHKDMRCGAVTGLHDASEAARLEEYRRLLYVALTRARDIVLVCGWQTARVHDECWYRMVERGMQRLPAASAAFPAWPGEALTFASPQTAPPEPARDALQETPASPPTWAGTAPDWRAAPLPAEPPRPHPLAPSRPEGVEFGPVPAVRSPLSQRLPDRMSRGLLMHALLQHLPALPAEARAAAAARFVAGAEGADTIVRQALAVLEEPACAALFGPGSRAEQPVSGVVEGQVVTGQVDRLAVLPDTVLVADYKTSRAPPASPEAVPVMYLRQMAAYRAVLQRIFTDRPVRCLLIWTDAPSVMPLPGALLDRHAPVLSGVLDPATAADHVVS
jgi:ATP-dependent helicase/nuclease subunit A